MDALMIENVHYGKIPGTPKPSLWQPGAEKLLLAFQLAPEHTIEDLCTSDAIRYRVRTRVRHIPSGAFVGEGVGEASSNEEKNRWRKAVCDAEWNEAPEDRRRKKWFKSEKGPYQVAQIRTESADSANTVLKMAKKRALVDAAKSTTGASDIFDQDLEDLPEGAVPEGTPPPPKVGTPKAKASTSASTTTESASGGGSGSPSLISSEKWIPVKAKWHDKGTVSEKQVKRLIAIGMQSGYSAEEIRQEIGLGLGGVTPETLPFGDVYDLTVALFSTVRPQ